MISAVYAPIRMLWTWIVFDIFGWQFCDGSLTMDERLDDLVSHVRNLCHCDVPEGVLSAVYVENNMGEERCTRYTWIGCFGGCCVYV